MITPPRNGGAGFIGKSGRKTANVCDKHAKETTRNTAARFMLFLLSLFYGNGGPKFPRKTERQ